MSYPTFFRWMPAMERTEMQQEFTSKRAARQVVWDTLQREHLARFPFPIHDRIPNFKGAVDAADLLMEFVAKRAVTNLKVYPDAPQRHVRSKARRLGITVYMPTPRLQAGFNRLDPAQISATRYRDAATLGKGHGYSDLEYAILRELGHHHVPVITTVHSVQVVSSFPRDVHDVGLSTIITDTDILEVASPQPTLDGIDWSLLNEVQLESMPVLIQLRLQ